MDRSYIPEVCVGFEQITDVSNVTTLTPPDQGAGLTLCLIQAEAFSVRWRADGVDPTSTVGALLPANAELEFTGDAQALARLQFIEAEAGAILNVHYFKNKS